MKHTVTLALTLFCLASFAQDRGFRTAGREFYLGYLHPTIGPRVYVGSSQQNYEKQFKVYALVSSFEDNEVSLSYFDPNGKEENPQIYKIAAGKTSHILLDRVRMRHDTVGDIAAFLSCHIVAKRPVSIQYFSTGPNSCGSYLALPVQSWGKEHVIASYTDNPGYGFGVTPDPSCGIFTVIAAYDGTAVTIIPSSKTLGGHVGATQGPGADGTPKPYTISLSRGQNYFVRSASSLTGNEDDISGSIIISSKPVAVIAGHENAYVGDGGIMPGASTRRDLREFLIEQMIPVKYWDNTGIISIPYRDSEGPITEGIGENFRLYVADKYLPSTVFGNEVSYNPSTYTTPVELSNRITPIHFSASPDSSRFMVLQYDIASHGTGSPFPGPSMNTLIPISEWSTSYLWSFPFTYDNYHGCAEHYVTVICEADKFNEIMVAVDNTSPRPINAALKSVQKTWNKGQISGYPEMKAVTYSIGVALNGSGGIYAAKASFPFMVYYIGNRASSTHYLDCSGIVDGTTHFYSYASPGGGSFFDKDVSNNISIAIDTLCTGGWKICATDNNLNGGIRYVSLLDDSSGYLFAGKSYKYSNVSILPPNDPLRIGEFTLPGDDKSYCFTIGINDPGKDAYAPVIIYDKAGNYKILDLRRSPQQLSVSPDPFTNPDLFSGSRIGVKVCTTFVIHNGASNQNSYEVETLSTSTQQFTIESMQPPLPATILPGDSLVFDVCFESSDTLLHRDTIHLTGTCLDLRFPLAASTVRPILIASDVTFGKVLLGKTVCKQVQLRNIGQASFTVQSGTFVQSGNEFAFDSVSSARFPFTIAAGATEQLTICYTPDTIHSSTGWITWQTDITPPISSEQKEISNLSGEGFEQGGGVEYHPTSDRIRIQPNPAQDLITISTELEQVSDASVVLYDVLGRQVKNYRFINQPAGSNSWTLDLQYLRSGAYTAVITIGGETLTRRLILE